MNKDLYNALEDALTSLESGSELNPILADHPELELEFGDVFETLLNSRQEVNQEIPVEILNRSRTRLLSRAMQLRQTPQPRSMRVRRTHRLAIAVIITLVILLSGGGLAVESAQALPGDQLYPVKRAAENIRLSLAVTLEDHRAVEDRYQARRINEVEQIFALGRSVFVQFYGPVNSQDGDSWDIGGIDVHQNPETILIGDILPGVEVEVEGLTIPEGWVQASEIHLQSLGFVGYVESISPEAWQISGRTVLIASQTQINPQIQIGDWVVVSAQSDDFGNLTAQLIDISDLPTPTPRPPALTPTLITTPDSDDEPAEELDGDRSDELHNGIGDDDSSIEDHEDVQEDQSKSEDEKEEGEEEYREVEKEGKDDD